MEFKIQEITMLLFLNQELAKTWLLSSGCAIGLSMNASLFFANSAITIALRSVDVSC